jgi:2-amino-4-hydroxy-6-hydroxymethyldihydropteridine diphosphokinase
MLGGNVGDTLHFFSRAIELARKSIGPVEKLSSVYSSSAWGFKNQPDFLNQAVLLSTGLGPLQVHEATLEIENLLGKKTIFTNGPRTIDIDILFYNDLILNNSGLEIPHPRLHLRRFNLEPLAEIIPEYVHPVLNEKIASLLDSCEDPLKVIKQNGI